MTIKLKRQQLYEDVWRAPMGDLARKLGIPSAKLRAACNAMEIPAPPLGYWKAVKAGAGSAAPPLLPNNGPNEVCIGATKKESLVEWVLRDREHGPVPSRHKDAPRSMPSVPAAPMAPTRQQPRLVPLAVWAALVFGEYAPHNNTLLKWIHEGRIQPQPKKIGRCFWLKPDAEYCGD